MEEGRLSPAQSLSAKPNLLRVELAPELTEISRLTGAFESLADQLKLPPAVAFALKLVLDELVTNIVSYGGIGPADGPIRVTFRADGDDLEISISDPGRPFDPRKVPTPATDIRLADRRVGGLGIHLVREMVDAFGYRYDNGRNNVTVRKRVRGETT